MESRRAGCRPEGRTCFPVPVLERGPRGEIRLGLGQTAVFINSGPPSSRQKDLNIPLRHEIVLDGSWHDQIMPGSVVTSLLLFLLVVSFCPNAVAKSASPKRELRRIHSRGPPPGESLLPGPRGDADADGCPGMHGAATPLVRFWYRTLMMLCPEPAFPLVGSVFVKVVHAVHERRLWPGKRPWGRILCEVCPSIYPIQYNAMQYNTMQCNTIQYRHRHAAIKIVLVIPSSGERHSHGQTKLLRESRHFCNPDPFPGRHDEHQTRPPRPPGLGALQGLLSGAPCRGLSRVGPRTRDDAR